MQIEKIAFSYWNPKTSTVMERIVYKITYKTLMVMEESFEEAWRKFILGAVWKKLLVIKK